MKKRVLKIGGLVLRFGLGVMWILGGQAWLRRNDPGGYLETALVQVIDQDMTLSFYKPFLEQTVLPNKELFASLVSWGEFLTGLSLLSGALVKISACIGAFLLLNYSMMNGSLFSPFNLLFIGLQVLLFFARPGRKFGIDGYLKKRWPESRIF